MGNFQCTVGRSCHLCVHASPLQHSLSLMAPAAALTRSAKRLNSHTLQGSAEAENTTEGRGGGATEGPSTEDTARQARRRKRRHKEHKRTKVRLHGASKNRGGSVPCPTHAGRLGRPGDLQPVKSLPAFCGRAAHAHRDPGTYYCKFCWGTHQPAPCCVLDGMAPLADMSNLRVRLPHPLYCLGHHAWLLRH